MQLYRRHPTTTKLDILTPPSMIGLRLPGIVSTLSDGTCRSGNHSWTWDMFVYSGERASQTEVKDVAP